VNSVEVRGIQLFDAVILSDRFGFAISAIKKLRTIPFVPRETLIASFWLERTFPF
jgi:hypothetical protein